MVLILDCISEIGVHVRSNLCYLTCLRHQIESSRKSDFSSPKRPTFLLACATFFQVPSNTSTFCSQFEINKMVAYKHFSFHVFLQVPNHMYLQIDVLYFPIINRAYSICSNYQHNNPEWTILSHMNSGCFFQEIFISQLLSSTRDSL